MHPAASAPAVRPRRLRLPRWPRRRVRREPGPVTIRRRRIYILPTRAGLVFTVLVVVMLLGAMNYSNSLGTALAFLLAAIGLLGMHHAHRNLLRLRVSGSGGEPVFAGDTARFHIRLENRTRLPRLGLLLVVSDGQGHHKRTSHADVPAGGTAELWLDVPAPARGRLRSPPFVIATRFPIGLFRAWSWLDLDLETLVYPLPSARAPVQARGDENNGRRHPLVADGDEFTGLRAYRRGDPPRRIHWKRSALSADPVVKEFSDTARPACWIDWDALAPLPAEERLSRMCRQVLDAHRDGERYGLRLPGVRLAPQAGETHRRACLRALALFPHHGGTAS